MSEFCPIERDQCIRLRFGEDDEDYILVFAGTDTIIRFADDKYDYLRLWDNEEGMVKAVFLGQTVLRDLISEGIPESEERDTITQMEYDLWLRSEKQKADAAEDRIIFGVDDVSLTDAEIDYFFGENGEWNHGEGQI